MHRDFGRVVSWQFEKGDGSSVPKMSSRVTPLATAASGRTGSAPLAAALPLAEVPAGGRRDVGAGSIPLRPTGGFILERTTHAGGNHVITK